MSNATRTAWLGKLSTCLLMLCAMTLTATAGVYKWTDANGKVDFSDKPPSGKEIKRNQVKTITQRGSSHNGASTKPVLHNNSGVSRSIKLEKIVIFPGKRAGRDAGVIKSGAACTRKYQRVSRATKRVQLRSPRFRDVILRVAKQTRLHGRRGR